MLAMLSQSYKAGFAFSTFYTLSNPLGTEVDLCAFGARIVAVRRADQKNLALSLPTQAAYAASDSMAGATIGPVAGRISGGQLAVLGKSFQLAQNDGSNTLHGGPNNLSRTLWRVSDSHESGIVFSCTLPDGLDGFPGNRTITAAYTLDETNTLTIRFTAVTDKATFLNLTNHTYWNLSGDFSAPAYGQLLEISADRVLYNDSMHLPVGSRDVRHTPFDFTLPRPIEDAMQSDPNHPQLVNAQGYNNAYLLCPSADFAARLIDPACGQRMTLRTDYPCLVFYSGGYLPVLGSAVALEAQYPPNTCEPVLLPGETYRHYISFQLETD